MSRLTCNRPKRFTTNCGIFVSEAARAAWEAKRNCGEPAVAVLRIGVSGQLTEMRACEKHTKEPEALRNAPWALL